MKIFVPSNIKGGLLNNQITIGPLSLMLRQLVSIMMGFGIGLVVVSQVNSGNDTSTTVAIIAGLPIFIITLVVTFFNVSELRFIPFCAKRIQTYFIDTPKKYFINYTKINPYEISMARIHTSKGKKHDAKTGHGIDDKEFDRLQQYV